MLLPIAPFTETSGSFVNAEGRVQSFHGVVKPLAETRPAWKVLRVLGNVLGLAGFDFETSEDVRAEALGGGIESPQQPCHRSRAEPLRQPRRLERLPMCHLRDRCAGAPCHRLQSTGRRDAGGPRRRSRSSTTALRCAGGRAAAGRRGPAAANRALRSPAT